MPPCAGSTTRSGCGIRPSTLPASLRMPAICARRAVDLVEVAESDAAFAFQAVERHLVGLIIAVVVSDREQRSPRRHHIAR